MGRIQAYRYRRDHGGREFDRWKDFEKSCESENFLTEEVRSWAIRFRSYFTARATDNISGIDTENLWPAMAGKDMFCGKPGRGGHQQFTTAGAGSKHSR